MSNDFSYCFKIIDKGMSLITLKEKAKKLSKNIFQTKKCIFNALKGSIFKILNPFLWGFNLSNVFLNLIIIYSLGTSYTIIKLRCDCIIKIVLKKYSINVKRSKTIKTCKLEKNHSKFLIIEIKYTFIKSNIEKIKNFFK